MIWLLLFTSDCVKMKYYGVLLLICCTYNVLGIWDENGERIGNPDDLAEIIRPCPTFDLNCIRIFFSNHANCRKVFGPAPDPLSRSEANYYLPRLNVSTASLQQQITGINGRVEEFFINNETDNLVIAVEFRNLNITGNNTYFIFHRRGREAVVTEASASVAYQSVVITAIIPKIDDLQIDKAECTAFSNDANPPTTVGPSVGESSDPQVQRAFAEYFADLPVNTQELFLTDAFYYIVAYIQYNICDFGLLVGI